MKISWNDFQDMIQAINNQSAVKELAAKEKWISEMVGQANAVKGELSQNKALLKEISEKQATLTASQAELNTKESDISTRAKSLAVSEQALNQKKENFDKYIAAEEAKLRLRAEEVQALENKASQKFAAAQEKLDHINKALDA